MAQHGQLRCSVPHIVAETAFELRARVLIKLLAKLRVDICAMQELHRCETPSTRNARCSNFRHTAARARLRKRRETHTHKHTRTHTHARMRMQARTNARKHARTSCAHTHTGTRKSRTHARTHTRRLAQTRAVACTRTLISITELPTQRLTSCAWPHASSRFSRMVGRACALRPPAAARRVRRRPCSGHRRRRWCAARMLSGRAGMQCTAKAGRFGALCCPV
jgi:hypothetical protein